MKLNLGSGDTKLDGFINVDLDQTKDVDVVADLSQDWPFDDDSVDEIVAKDIFEHLPDQIHTMNEAFRVLKPGGILHVYVPTTDSLAAFADPTHKSFWNENTFLYFSVDAEVGYSQIVAKFKILAAKSFMYTNWPNSRGIYVQLKKPVGMVEAKNAGPNLHQDVCASTEEGNTDRTD